MKKQEVLPVAVVSTVLLLYIGLIVLFPRSAIINLIYLVFPFLLFWTACSIIRYGQYKGKELKEGEEWAYADKQKDELNIF